MPDLDNVHHRLGRLESVADALVKEVQEQNKGLALLTQETRSFVASAAKSAGEINLFQQSASTQLRRIDELSKDIQSLKDSRSALVGAVRTLALLILPIVLKSLWSWYATGRP